MNFSRKTNTVKIPYRDGKIVKELSLNLDNEHDARFYDSYHKIPLDNRNYMASLYASEQERGVNDDVGHRLQDLALITPKEDTVIMREKRNAELESLNESKKHYEQRIKYLRTLKANAALTEDQKAELEDAQKQVDAIKRKIRNIDSTWTKAVNAEIFGTGHFSGVSSLTKDSLSESLNKIADNLNQRVVEFLEDKFEQLPANDDGSTGDERYVLTNAAYLSVLCQLIGVDISKLGDAIKSVYALLKSITEDTLTAADYANTYNDAVDYVVRGLTIFSEVHIADAFADGRLSVVVEQIKPVCASIAHALGSAVYKAYTEAEQLNMPNWRTIKGILNASNGFKTLLTRGKEYDSFQLSDRYRRSLLPFTVLYEAIESAAANIYQFWATDTPGTKNDDFRRKESKFNNPRKFNAVGANRYTKLGNKTSNYYNTVRLDVFYSSASNRLTIRGIDVLGTKLKRPLANIAYDNWLGKPFTIKGKGRKTWREPNIQEGIFKTTVANDILRELHMNNQGEMPPDVMKDLTTKGAGIDSIRDASTFGDIDEAGTAQYRALDAPESEFHNIIDMGNPLKAIRSTASQKRVAISKSRR